MNHALKALVVFQSRRFDAAVQAPGGVEVFELAVAARTPDELRNRFGDRRQIAVVGGRLFAPDGLRQIRKTFGFAPMRTNEDVLVAVHDDENGNEYAEEKHR